MAYGARDTGDGLTKVFVVSCIDDSFVAFALRRLTFYLYINRITICVGPSA